MTFSQDPGGLLFGGQMRHGSYTWMTTSDLILEYIPYVLTVLEIKTYTVAL